MKTQDYHWETQHVQKLNMNFFINSREKNHPSPKTSILLQKRALLFIGKNKVKAKNKKNKKMDWDPLFPLFTPKHDQTLLITTHTLIDGNKLDFN